MKNLTLIIFYVLIGLFGNITILPTKFIYFINFFIMNMKKYSKVPAQGFTLVELIVVIVILAILATIAFLSFGSQSAAARDSKRRTDLSNIASKMNIAMAQWTTVLNLVWDNTATVTDASIAWTWAIPTAGTTQNYNAWQINFNVLWVAAWDFKDADGTNTYKIGATSNAGTAFQLAATLENSWDAPGKNGLVVGNFSSRDVATSSWILTYTSWAITATLNSTIVGLYKKNDWVKLYNGATLVWTAQITNVSSDLASITIPSYASAINVINLAIDESAWLVASSVDAHSWVINADTTFYPY